MGSLAVARYSIFLLLKHHVTGLFLIGAVGLVGVSYVLTNLTPGTERRTFFNLAYLGVEMLGVLVPLLGSTVLRIAEFEQRTIWLVLVRPVTRSGYVLGRFFGLTTVAWVTLAAVLATLAVLAGLAGSLPEPYLVPVFWACLLEAALVSAVCTMFSLLATSYLLALVFSVGLVLAGYLSAVLPYLADRIGSAAGALAVRALYWILPHLGSFSVRDFASPPESWYVWLLAIYALAFTGAILALTCLLFHRREI